MKLPKQFHRGGRPRKKGSRGKNKSFNFGLNFVKLPAIYYEIKK